MQDMDLKCRTLQDMQDIVDTMSQIIENSEEGKNLRINLSFKQQNSVCRSSGYHLALLTDRLMYLQCWNASGGPTV